MKKLSKSFRLMKVNRIIDDKFMEFLNLTIDNYIGNWYSSINDSDQLFIDELKSHLKCSLSVFAYRLKHLDVTDLIFDRFLPPVLDFLNFFFEIEKICESKNVILTDEILTEKMLEIYSANSKLHPALYNRTSEMNYLRDISQYLLENCLNFEINYTTSVLTILREVLAVCILSPVMDVLADPGTLNFLLETLFSDRTTDLSNYEQNIGQDVEFLANFASNYAQSNSFFAPTLSDILNNQPLLYIFINFMKRIQGPMNFLQFLLSVHQLRLRLTSQIMEPVQKETLDMIRWEIWELYRNYLHNQSNDRICQLDDQVLKTFRNLTENHDLVFSDIKLTIIYVYDHISHNFDRNYVSGYFVTSEEYLQYISGTFNYADNPDDDHNENNVIDPDSVEIFRKTLKNVLQSRPLMRSCDSPQLSSISSRRESTSDQELSGSCLKGDISTVTAEKDPESLLDLSSCPGSAFESALNSAEIFAEDVMAENILMNECPDFGAAVKDLSRWTADISYVEPRRDLQSTCFAAADRLSQNITKVIIEKQPKTVAINSKLPRNSNCDISQSGKTIYVYVVAVSRNDVLSAHPSNEIIRPHFDCSDSSVRMNSISRSNYGPTHSWKIDRKYHEFYVLEAKLVEFHTDTILNEQPLPPKKMFNVKSRAFVESMRPEFDRFLKRLLKNKHLKHSELLYTFLTSTDELTLGFLINPFQIPSTKKLKLWTIFRCFSKKQLNSALKPPRIAYLIDLLANRIYKNRVQPDISSKERTLTTVRQFVDRHLHTNLFISEKLIDGYGKILNCVQYPVTNKHLSFILLDIALCELFPELRRKEL
uniref:Sorting nexin-14 n=1 Tax=Romanomermis culicivorax TaxID=13658 RepID=A0A915LA11_ROMCU